MNTHNCHINADCKDTVGSFECKCHVGYEGDGIACLDEDECLDDTSLCEEGKVCVNKIGYFECICPNGTKEEDVNCVDINECEFGADNCDEKGNRVDLA